MGFFVSMVKRRAFFVVLISEITRCVYEVTLPNLRDNVRGRYKGLTTEQVAKKHGRQVGVGDGLLIASGK